MNQNCFACGPAKIAPDMTAAGNCACRSQKPFTVVGFHWDSQERFCDHVSAATANAAEDLVLQNRSCAAVVAVFDGHLAAQDSSPEIRMGD